MNYEQECKKCGHKWISRVLKPKVCPRCKAYDYKNDTKEVKKEVTN